MAPLMENAEVVDDLIQGKRDEDGFKTRRKEPQGKQFSAKGNVTSRLTVPPFKKKPFAGSKPFAGNMPFYTGNRLNAENQQMRPPPFSGQRQGFKRHFTGKTIEERKVLRDAKKCYICEEGHFANECPQRYSKNKDDKFDRKGKKPKPSARLVPDLVGDQQNVDATELCRVWGKVRDQEVLAFFDPGARANFISPELASKSGIRGEEMRMTGEAGLACLDHSEAVTPILGKLRLHIQSYVDAEEFHIMPLQDCDVLLGIPWCYRRFIRHFVEIASPLYALTHKGVTFKWTTKEITAFKHLKETLTSDPVIILPDLLKPFVVQCDACGNSLGAVLMQDGRVVAYESRVFSDRERTLQIYEKEMLAIMHALYSWKHFLLGADFIVQTDHQTLRYFLTQAKLSEQHMRWANFLSMFHFQIVHVEGKKNVVADALLRKPQVSAVSISYHNELEEMKGQYAKDEDFARIYDQIINGQRHEHYTLKSDFLMMHGKL
ncbi:hypothetical protein L7F22_045307 [Adiantum nelumboides]|nr:hypothetical protein [Adiantum nelumboides]